MNGREKSGHVMAKVALPKSGPLDAKIGPHGPYLSAENGPALPKTVRYSDRIHAKSVLSVASFFFLQLEDKVPGLLFTIL